MLQDNLSDIAFNKFAPIGDVPRSPRSLPEPLKRKAYPLTPGEAKRLREETNADAVVLQGDIQLSKPRLPTSWEQEKHQRQHERKHQQKHRQQKEHQHHKPHVHMIDHANPDYWKLKPIYPEDPQFMNEMKAVVDLQIARRNNQHPKESVYQWPKIMEDCKVAGMNAFTLEDIATAVNGEYPASIQQTFIEEVYKTHKMTTPGGNDCEIIVDLGQPFRSNIDFIGLQVRMGALNTWSFEAVAAVNFMLKWTYGLPRPEEIAWLIHKKKIRDDLTQSEAAKAVVVGVQSMELESPKDFTAYKSGSPTHPSFPAMHSAGSTCSLWLPVLYNLTAEEYEQALLVDHAVAFGRTVAGVHYPQDNLAGLNVGQGIVGEQLPAFVAERYGYDAEKVAARVKELRFDWNEFDSKTLTIDGKPVAEFLEAANEKTGVVTRKINKKP